MTKFMKSKKNVDDFFCSVHSSLSELKKRQNHPRRIEHDKRCTYYSHTSAGQRLIIHRRAKAEVTFVHNPAAIKWGERGRQFGASPFEQNWTKSGPNIWVSNPKPPKIPLCENQSNINQRLIKKNTGRYRSFCGAIPALPIIRRFRPLIRTGLMVLLH